MEAIFAAVYLDACRDIDVVKAVLGTLGLFIPVLNLPQRTQIFYNALDG